ncbi:hypothetical protein HN51_069906 [Arachis hypogaea]
MIKQMRLRKSAVSVFGYVHEVKDNMKDREAQTDGDPELLDDSEFFHNIRLEVSYHSQIPNSLKAHAFDAVKKGDTIFIGQYLFTRNETTSVRRDQIL